MQPKSKTKRTELSFFWNEISNKQQPNDELDESELVKFRNSSSICSFVICGSSESMGKDTYI